MPQIRKWLGVSTILREYPITKLIAVTNMFFCDEWPLASEWWCTEECVSRQGHVSPTEEWFLSGVVISDLCVDY